MSHSAPSSSRRSWPWVVLVIVVVVGIIVGASVLSTSLGSSPSAPQTSAAPTGSAPTASVTLGPTGAPTPAASATSGSTKLDESDIEAAIETGTYTDLYSALADPVHITIAASDFDADRTPDQAMTDLEYLTGSSGWSWSLDTATLAAFAAGPYSAEFGPRAIVGESVQGWVVVLDRTGRSITGILMSRSERALTTTASSPAPTATP